MLHFPITHKILIYKHNVFANINIINRHKHKSHFSEIQFSENTEQWILTKNVQFNYLKNYSIFRSVYNWKF